MCMIANSGEGSKRVGRTTLAHKSIPNGRRKKHETTVWDSRVSVFFQKNTLVDTATAAAAVSIAKIAKTIRSNQEEYVW